MTLLSRDRTLLDGFRRGDREALARVYREYAPGIAAFLARGFTFKSKGRLLQFRGYHSPFDQDNALQETFLRAFSERARLAYDGLSPFKSYLTTIARNYVLTELRNREIALSQLVRPVENSSAQEDQLEQLEKEGANWSSETELMHREIGDLYCRFVEKLEEPVKGYFVARFEKQLTQVEAGKENGLSHMQARTLEKKLRKGFLAYMHECGYLAGYKAVGS
jgi:RNA polymerase sigma-70 factor (ECF subfamily)